MYDNDFVYYPDGLTEAVIDVLIAEAFGPEPTSHPPRRGRRVAKRTLGATVRALRALPVQPVTTEGEAA